ncbi:MAG: hypothetical protein M1429_00480 [Patescibacteria group bacterium]|nr:hypothetical protein [Patescibacteria group bacterium]
MSKFKLLLKKFRSRWHGVSTCPKETLVASLSVTYLARCGHKTKLREEIGPKDDRREITLLLTENRPDFCLSCLESAIIRCAWCGQTIWPDNPITLYETSQKDFQPKDGSRLYSEKDGYKTYVGCLRWNCADTLADRAGFWRMPGFVERQMSPIEQCLNTGEMVVVEDIKE